LLLVGIAGHLAAGCSDDNAGHTNTTVDAGGVDGSTDGAPADSTPTDADTTDAFLHDGSTDGEVDADNPPPDQPGTHDIEEVEATVERGYRDTPLVAHLPVGDASEVFPVVVFIPGFQVSSWRYEPLALHVASHGFVFVRCDPTDVWATMDHVEMSQDVMAVIDWVAEDPVVSPRADTTRLVTMGHSLGGKVAAMVAWRDDRVDGVFGIDPVNAIGPYGYTSSCPDVLPDEVAPLTIPLAFAGETTNAMPAFGYNACAPESANFERYYEAAESSPWAVKLHFSGADHIDFIDDIFGCSVCYSCEPGTADRDDVLAALRTLAAAFARMHLKGEQSMSTWLIGQHLPPGVTEAHKP
jgi:pimeloyl-ACP methyl ester carboxylesterase